jgi:hypothetical protein
VSGHLRGGAIGGPSAARSWHDRPVTSRCLPRTVIGCLLGVIGAVSAVSAAGSIGACGRIGFDSTVRVADAVSGDGAAMPTDATIDGAADAAIDGAIDAGLCEYLPTCMTGEITCCTATSSFCTIESMGSCPGTIARCSIFTQQGCPPGWACCSTTQRPEPSCYDPIMPQPC